MAAKTKWIDDPRRYSFPPTRSVGQSTQPTTSNPIDALSLFSRSNSGSSHDRPICVYPIRLFDLRTFRPLCQRLNLGRRKLACGNSILKQNVQFGVRSSFGFS